MKVLLIHSSAELYGSDRCVIWMASGLKDKGYQVEVVLPFPGPLEDKLEEIRVPVHILDPVVFRRSIMKPSALAGLMIQTGPRVMQLRNLIKHNNYNLVHSNTGVVVGGALAARLSGVPHIWHFREMLTEFRRLWGLYEPLVINTSSEIVCISRAVAGQFKSGKATAKVCVVHDGIPEAKLQPVFAEKESGKLKLVSVGRLAPYKSQDILIGSMKALVDLGLDVELTLVGDVFGNQTSYREKLKQDVRMLGLESRVAFAGFCEDVTPYLRQADIFVMPSRRPEGLGLVILEAMNQGKPVVATRGGGVAEIITNGVNGVLVEPGDEQDLTGAIQRLAVNPEIAASMGAEGRRTVKEHFSLQHMNSDLEKVYMRVLRG